MSHRIYISASYSHRNRMRGYAAALIANGHWVVSSWLFLPGEDDGVTTEGTNGELRSIAHRDLEEVEACDLFLAFTEPPGSPWTRGGRHCELGTAIALKKTIWLIGDGRFENVFQALADRCFYDWPACLEHLQSQTPALAAERA